MNVCLAKLASMLRPRPKLVNIHRRAISPFDAHVRRQNAFRQIIAENYWDMGNNLCAQIKDKLFFVFDKVLADCGSASLGFFLNTTGVPGLYFNFVLEGQNEYAWMGAFIAANQAEQPIIVIKEIQVGKQHWRRTAKQRRAVKGWHKKFIAQLEKIAKEAGFKELLVVSDKEVLARALTKALLREKPGYLSVVQEYYGQPGQDYERQDRQLIIHNAWWGGGAMKSGNFWVKALD